MFIIILMLNKKRSFVFKYISTKKTTENEYRVLRIEFSKVTASENFGATILAAGVLALLLFRWHFTPWNTTPPQLFAYTVLTYLAVLLERSVCQFTEIDNALSVKKWAQFVVCVLVLAALCLAVSLAIAAWVY